MKTEECLACDGKGTNGVVITTFPPKTEWMPCTSCGGTGRIPIAVYTPISSAIGATDESS